MVQKIGEQKKERKEPLKNKMNVVVVIRRRKEALIALLRHCVIWCNQGVAVHIMFSLRDLRKKLILQSMAELAALSLDGEMIPPL